jgi:hypothetical protein
LCAEYCPAIYSVRKGVGQQEFGRSWRNISFGKTGDRADARRQTQPAAGGAVSLNRSGRVNLCVHPEKNAPQLREGPHLLVNGRLLRVKGERSGGFQENGRKQ